jgi:hypothetical protein
MARRHEHHAWRDANERPNDENQDAELNHQMVRVYWLFIGLVFSYGFIRRTWFSWHAPLA